MQKSFGKLLVPLKYTLANQVAVIPKPMLGGLGLRLAGRSGTEASWEVWD